MNDTKDDFAKTVRPGTMENHDIFCRIEWKDGKLSITGVHGPKRNGDAFGGCGQIILEFKEYDARGYRTLADVSCAPGWTPETLRLFFDVWSEYHNNNLQAGCEHQRKMGWNKIPIDPSKPLTAYGKHFEGQQYDSWNMLTWVSPKQYEKGLLGVPCPECGYKYGTGWQTMKVPDEVIGFLQSLPDTDKTPAWV